MPHKPEIGDDLYGMTYEDAGEALPEADAAVLPTGSIEQHSVHLPVSVDTIRADHLSAALVEAAADHDLAFVRLPALPYGYSEHHMNYPGTVTLTQDTYRDAVIEVGESLAEHGVDRLVLLNCHGGNREPLAMAADRLGRDHDVTTHLVHWTAFAATTCRRRSARDGATPATTRPASSNCSARTSSRGTARRSRTPGSSPRRGRTRTSTR